MKVKVLIDNLTQSDIYESDTDIQLTSEWGLSVAIEYNGHYFLLDTGKSGLFADNANKLGVDLSAIEFGVLSHAHYDHSDGMDEFFSNNKDAVFFLRNGSSENCYRKLSIFMKKYIGIKHGLLEKYKDRIVYVDGDYEILNGVKLIPHKTPHLEKIGKTANMYTRENNKWQYDSFAHEQSLVFETEKGLVILNSCSHGGADNIINEVAATYPNHKIHALIGGFHLFRSSDKDIYALADRIKETQIDMIMTGHCTGIHAFELLNSALPGQVKQLYTGLEIDI